MDYDHSTTDLARCQGQFSPNASPGVIEFSQMSMLDFWDWVDHEIERRGLSYHRIEREAGLANAAISRPARNRSKPSLAVCKAIAAVFELPDVEVLRRAGLIDSAPSASPSVIEEERAVYVIRELSPAARKAAVAMLEGLRRADERDAREDRRTNAHRTQEEPTSPGTVQPGDPEWKGPEWFGHQLAQLPSDATDAEIREIVHREIDRFYEEESQEAFEFLARFFNVIARMRREERREQANDPTVIVSGGQ